MANNQALITGINGFCGRTLARHLLLNGYSVTGIDIINDPILDIPIYVGDIRDSSFLNRVILETKPTHVFHLAAIVDPRAALSSMYELNVIGTECVLETIRKNDIDPIILITGSSSVYGNVEKEDLPITETQPFNPLNAYAISKISQEMLALAYYSKYGQRIIRTRTFNLVGPGEPPSLACSAFAKQIIEIIKGHQNPQIHVGNLTTQRDLTDVRDVVTAYQMLAEMGMPGQVYNVCSGKVVTIQACLDKLIKLGRVQIEIVKDPDRMRLSDIPISLGDNQLLFKHTGWRPAIPLEQSLYDLLDDWRRRIKEV